ncbi:hypothetical protein B0H67DRAFT_499742 [Lasiosphaeris hirsuta]|uniref:Uncharacterized protein n=1 Tax=Lasiosphaeris hirsuta TaxID=260670 RepID=A0AA39ZSI4_9PEZI|nr:hypothetical protein B0H67DRAFT_499742 [Lasiosphaeris hirsuta]
MADSAGVYTPPSVTSYMLLKSFDMPTRSGSIRAVAFSSKSGALVTAALSVMFTFIFLFTWNLVCFIALLSSNEKSRHRFAALVLLWNSNDSWFALPRMLHYAWVSFKSGGHETAYGLLWAFLAFAVSGASLALGIVGPSLVQIGHAAPVQPVSAYFPVLPPQNDASAVLQVFGLRASSYLRALGSVEAADVTKRQNVDMQENINLPPWNDTEPMYQMSYTYSITGQDLGLQRGSGLSLNVTGSCITEYEWDAKLGGGNNDTYNMWGYSDENNPPFSVPLDDVSIQSAPKVSFFLHPDFVQQFGRDSNISFAAIVWAAHRASITDGSDAWYVTETGEQNYAPPFGATRWIKRRRPALSCWQKDTWRYGTQLVKNVEGLKNVQGMRIPVSLLQVLEITLSLPKLVELGNASGDSALRSRTTSPNGVIDARASSIRSDMERLLVASYVASQSVFTDATMFQQDGTWRNTLEGGNGQPKEGAGDFIIVSPEIQTFSLGGLIAVVVCLGALMLTEGVVTFIIRHHDQPTKNEISNNRLIRFKVLTAVDLFRRIYEPGGGGKDEDNWGCSKHFPTCEDDNVVFKLKDCESSNGRCRGHIDPSSKKQ